MTIYRKEISDKKWILFKQPDGKVVVKAMVKGVLSRPMIMAAGINLALAYVASRSAGVKKLKIEDFEVVAGGVF